MTARFSSVNGKISKKICMTGFHKLSVNVKKKFFDIRLRKAEIVTSLEGRLGTYTAFAEF